eukprot:CAMPEP_0174363458 /NCGR_PEP_ID=MMETSP0811_2-20130205/68905_1 /TAXON_ID=73025 ORGANISM="Eutreptiella gymnastica-like, Strain CCMP1594" /NCGR_SAMPLE_ID=MMETSP0811_2 /ASSEMBLY_ACC=CAM_ASM_000667 /LENGTH=117 /DNA_ID=CAMNT_0015502167 /DNA_START=494 /DNA_END=847 /DNA_ORIENTATION=-
MGWASVQQLRWAQGVKKLSTVPLPLQERRESGAERRSCHLRQGSWARVHAIRRWHWAAGSGWFEQDSCLEWFSVLGIGMLPKCASLRAFWVMIRWDRVLRGCQERSVEVVVIGSAFG